MSIRLSNSDFLDAIACGDSKVVETAILSGTEKRVATVGGKTAAHIATEARHPEIFRILLGYGFPVTTADQQGNTPLHTAAKAGLIDVINLIAYFFPAALEIRNHQGQTAADVAVEEKQQVAALRPRELSGNPQLSPPIDSSFRAH